jgi:UDP-N-acetylmuramoyl-L-alanyl-D-glutamate--2,6-diaminopimelate ligase
MLLSNLLKTDLPEELDCNISGLTLDSRAVRPGEVFFALAGTQQHGEVYIKSSLEKGASAILKEASVAGIEQLDGGIPCISIPNLSQQVGAIAARFYNNPSDNMQVIGVTGTNGKTSITHAIAYLLNTQNTACGVLGTLGYGVYGNLKTASHTTPDAISLQALFAKLKTEVSTVAMEVSSHALVQGRVNAINFDTAVFTNLSRDHLDYHKTMQAYGEAKLRLFTMPNLKTAIINSDDAFGQQILNNLASTVTPLTYSLHDKSADIYAKIERYDNNGSVFTIQGEQCYFPWFGEFNISNILAVLAVLLNSGYSLSKLLQEIKTLPAVPGRMERFGTSDQPTIIIDYSHTPDALKQALLTLKQHNKGILWCVFGCGGDRDKGKRPIMGEVAQTYADKVIITDDNPRHETSQSIIDEILQGCPKPEAVIANRKLAIEYALQQATVDDIVLIAGKGHEDYQEIGDQRLPFSDRELVSNYTNKLLL